MFKNKIDKHQKSMLQKDLQMNKLWTLDKLMAAAPLAPGVSWMAISLNLECRVLLQTYL